MKAATIVEPIEGYCYRISIHAAREGGDCFHLGKPAFVRISIHAAREGGDKLQAVLSGYTGNFNPRRP